METNKKVLIAAGGTGGHLYPGLALSKELKRRNFEPIFIIGKKDNCKEYFSDEKYFEIPVKGMPRSISFKTIKFFYLLVLSIFRTWKLFKTLHPCAVYGMGGYVSFPVVFVAKIYGIPTIIHEQNYIPGLANKVVSKFADKITVSYEDTKKYFNRKKTVLTGNPVRTDIFGKDYSDSCKKLGVSQGKFSILVFGGSQGAKKINDFALESYKLLESNKDRVQYLLISGKNDYERIKGEYERNNIPGKVFSYIESIGDAYEIADMIICRAGATTIAELNILNKPSVLVPYPFATANHQEYNAKVLVNSNKAKMILEKDLTASQLAAEITHYLKNYSGHGNSPILPKPLPQEIMADLI
ncbi:undecaprenyldiphospho-muramoylpentapeptide beta-N-acetylglucosaminyltransferase [Elusimicrobiota bacterium]